jgi:copper chaperone NosL
MNSPLRPARGQRRWAAPAPAPALAVLLLVLLAALTGCERKQELAAAFPQSVTADTACAVDGMLLLNHPGPKAQIVHSDGTRTFYCDVREALEARHDPEQGHTVAQVFVQPMDGRDWAARPDGWAELERLHLVLGSRRMGHMGPTVVPFRQRAAADAFSAAEGGRVLAAAELTGAVVTAYAAEVRAVLRDLRMGTAPAAAGKHPGTGTDGTKVANHGHAPAGPPAGAPHPLH